MFSSEYAIALTLADGSTVSLFADKKIVDEKQGRFRLKVTLINRNEEKHTDLVLLPTETFETASRWAVVPSE
jgi:hypothetical protein